MDRNETGVSAEVRSAFRSPVAFRFSYGGRQAFARMSIWPVVAAFYVVVDRLKTKQITRPTLVDVKTVDIAET